jgi:hypothetical protein
LATLPFVEADIQILSEMLHFLERVFVAARGASRA